MIRLIDCNGTAIGTLGSHFTKGSCLETRLLQLLQPTLRLVRDTPGDSHFSSQRRDCGRRGFWNSGRSPSSLHLSPDVAPWDPRLSVHLRSPSHPSLLVLGRRRLLVRRHPRPTPSERCFGLDDSLPLGTSLELTLHFSPSLIWYEIPWSLTFVISLHWNRNPRTQTVTICSDRSTILSKPIQIVNNETKLSLISRYLLFSCKDPVPSEVRFRVEVVLLTVLREWTHALTGIDKVEIVVRFPVYSFPNTTSPPRSGWYGTFPPWREKIRGKNKPQRLTFLVLDFKGEKT